jgi:hypothetical protein
MQGRSWAHLLLSGEEIFRLQTQFQVLLRRYLPIAAAGCRGDNSLMTHCIIDRIIESSKRWIEQCHLNKWPLGRQHQIRQVVIFDLANSMLADNHKANQHQVTPTWEITEPRPKISEDYIIQILMDLLKPLEESMYENTKLTLSCPHNQEVWNHGHVITYSFLPYRFLFCLLPSSFFVWGFEAGRWSINRVNG